MSSQRFTVTKADEEAPIGDKRQDNGSYGAVPINSVQLNITEGEDASRNRDSEPLAGHDELENPYEHQMALYEDDLQARGKISQILNRIANYQAGIEPNMTKEYSDKDKQAKLGTLFGVYLPTIQNIFGVLLFIRMTWIVGMAGLLESLGIVFVCCLTTLLTAISMSAIATNGVVPAGGSYFMISRALGPEFGGAVGILFYLGTTVASSMYIIGSVEILLKFIAPQISLFGDVTIEVNALNNYRLYGTIILLLLSVIVFIGVRFVSKFAALSLACVILSIFCIYIGFFASNADGSVRICYLGDRLLTSSASYVNGSMYCNKNNDSGIFARYCTVGVNQTTTCNDYFNKHETKVIAGIPGLSSGVIKNNLYSRYTMKDRIIGQETHGNRHYGEVVADITSSLMVLLAIYFPSVTGIMAGSNRSGDLADASRSIPVGTICAILTTSFVYVTCVIFFAVIIEGDLMRDKFGESINGGLVVAKLSWPNEWVILIGSFLSTLGAGLQSLTGAPRLLQAIACDGVIPFLNIFSVTTKRGEPFRALVMTVMISEIGICIANLDYVAPIITMFFLMCYGFVNMACALQTLLRTPSWRPRFQFYHWILSLLGLALCITLMFISSWYYALTAICVAAIIYKYIEYKGAEKEWGDGIRGLAMSAARYSLLRVQQGPPHTKNWRPQLLVLMKMDTGLTPKYPKMVTFASQLKAGKGLTLINSVLPGDYTEKYADAQAAKQSLNKLIETTGIKGFADVVIAKDVTDGLCHLIQNSGLGGLRHNTVMIGWPYGWRHSGDERSHKVFVDAIKNINAGQMALLAVKGINQFPDTSEKLSGTIDIWWIVHDGGMLMLLPFLLKQHRTFKNCRLRIFTVAQLEDNTVQMKKDLETFMYQLRINAEVEVVEMSNNDISAYTYERTLMMEQRSEMLKVIRRGSKTGLELKRKKQVLALVLIEDLRFLPLVREIQHLSTRSATLHSCKDGISHTCGRNPRSSIGTRPQNIIDSSHPKSPAQLKVKLETVHEDGPSESSTDSIDRNQFTFTPSSQTNSKPTTQTNTTNDLLNIKPDKKNVRRMHTAVRLNEVIIEKSHEAQMVILNLPAPPKSLAGELNYMEFLEVLTEGIDRVLMVRGSGHEVITIYS